MARLACGSVYAVRVFDIDCVVATPSDPACFRCEFFTAGQSARFPAGFPRASALTPGRLYVATVTGQELAPSHAFAGFSVVVLQP